MFACASEARELEMLPGSLSAFGCFLVRTVPQKQSCIRPDILCSQISGSGVTAEE